MDYMNSTYLGVATLLPYTLPSLHKASSTHGDLAPLLINVDPWTLFDKLWTAVVGYPAGEFEYVQGETPMSTFKETAIFIALYYVVVLGGRELMRNRQAFKLNKLFIIHNFYLTAISGSLLVLFIQQLAPGLWREGFLDGICGKTGWTQPLVVLYYLNYLTKYLELLDTVFLVLKKKPLTFLHTYHHGATAALCYTQLRGNTSVSWVPITLNLTVHVVMYWYYFQSARGVRVWWKQYITMLQISQFVIDLGVVYFATYTHYAALYFNFMPNCGACNGEPFAAFSGCAILTSYLFLFIGFYFTTYKPKTATSVNAKKAARRASMVELPTVQETGEKVTDVINTAKESILETVTDERSGCAVRI